MMNIPPSHLTEQMSTYVDCMREARMRFERAEDLSIRCLKRGEVNELDVEFISLQLRKVIELIALASIAAVKKEYEIIREKFSNDWNARLIFRDIERINPNFFPIPFEISGVDEMKAPTYRCMNKEESLDLYADVSTHLHSRNRYAARLNYGEILGQFSKRMNLLKNLLRSFEAHTIPAEYLYFVIMHFQEDTPVQIALAGYVE